MKTTLGRNVVEQFFCKKYWLAIVLSLLIYPLLSGQSITEKELLEQAKAAIQQDESGEFLDADTVQLNELSRVSLKNNFFLPYIRAQRYLGDYYYRNGELLKSNIYFHRALEKTELLPTIDEEYIFLRQRIANTYLNLGRIDEAQGIFKEIIPVFDELVTLYPEDSLALQYRKTNTLSNYAISFVRQGKYDMAIDLYQQSMAIIKPSLFKTQGAYVYAKKFMAFQMGSAYLFKGDGVSARPYVEEHLAYIKEQNIDPKFIAQSYGNLAYCHFLLKNYSDAYHFYGKSLELSEKHGFSDVSLITYKDMADTYLDEKNYVEGLRISK